MKEGTFIRRFTAWDGREVTLRAPRWSDLDDMLEFINSLVEEGADISMDTPQTRESEIDWLAGHLSSIEKDRKIAVAAEVGGRFVGQVEVSPRGRRSMHVGVLGIAIREGYRDVGIGTEMMKEAEAQSGRLGIEIMTLDVFDTNERARHVYRKLGYEEVGRIPKAVSKDGEYFDSIIMAKEIT